MSESPEWKRFTELCDAGPSYGSGAKWIAIDFHFHTPASDDHKYGGSDDSTYDQIADRLEHQSIDAVFVTDHNEWQGIERLANAISRRRSRTKVYAGAELSVSIDAARIGDGLTHEQRKIRPYLFHCLALFPDASAPERIKALVTNHFKNEAILDAKPTERRLVQPLQEIAEGVRAWGGILMPAHFHQGKAPEKSRSFDDVYCDELAIRQLHSYFDAIEIRDGAQAMFFDGMQKGNNGELIPEMGCVLGSDAHSLDGVGLERTFLLVENNTFQDIATSLRYRERISFAERGGGRDLIEHLVVEGAFLPTSHFSFNQGLNALIGTKGAGKTAVLECTRFALGEATASNLDNYLQHVLGPSGRVWLSVRNKRGERFLFVRARGEAVPRVLAESGDSVTRDAVIPVNFQVEIHGWGEVTQLAENPGAQLRLLDAVDSKTVALRVSSRIHELRGQLAPTFAQVADTLASLRAARTDLDQLTLKKARLDKLKVAKITDEQAAKEKRDAEVGAYQELSRVLLDRQSEIPTVIAPSIADQLKGLRVAYRNERFGEDEVALRALALEDRAAALQAQVGEALQDFLNDSAAITAECVSELQRAFAPREDEYQRIFASLDPNEQDVLIARNEIVAEIARLPTVQTRFDGLSQLFLENMRKYADLLSQIHAAIVERSAARLAIARELSQRLSAARVPTRILLTPATTFSGSVPPGVEAAAAFGSLSERLRKVTIQEALQGYGLELNGGVRAEFSFEIQDTPVIEFELYHGVWRSSAQLSAGQKSTAVLPLIIMVGDGPDSCNGRL